MTNFIQIKETRLAKSTIKRYKPIGNSKLSIGFTASRTKLDYEIFTFSNQKERDEILNILDNML